MWALQDVLERGMAQDHNGCYEMRWKMLMVDGLKTGSDGGVEADGEIRTLAAEPGV